MKILQFIDTLIAGGAERMAVNISNVLADNGYEVWLCASRTGGALEHFVDKKVNYLQLAKKHGLDIAAFFRLVKLIRKNKITLIHAHSSSVFWAVAAKVFCPGVKVIWHDHLGKRIDEDKFNRIIIIISSWINAVIAVNDSLKAWSQKKLNVPDSKIVFINNFPLLREAHAEEIKENETLQIVCLANLRWQKDHITLIKAIEIIANIPTIQPFKVVLAGLYYNDEYFEMVKSLINKKQLTKYFEITGSVNNTASLLYNSDIGILSSVSEGLPVSLLEYGLAGLPVVVTNVGQCAEVMEYGNAGLVVPPENPDEMASALLQLIQNADKRALLGAKFKERVVNNYGAMKFLVQYEALLKNTKA
ncbi:MAG: glycosyltransferase family 4 protein [Bacteroidales bacterium]|nr:glycosyltransferase family 4 protein [Bacteroidales bacterium]